MAGCADVISDAKQSEKEKFKKKVYWEERYEKEEHFDWFCELPSFEHLLLQHLTHTDRILNLGCGNSNLSASLCAKGYRNIDSIDFSETVIAKMKERSLAMPTLKWHVMDMLELRFDSESFDVVIDKGSIDALMVDQEDVWNPKQEVIKRVEKALTEAFRVLKAGGHFISVTFSQPHFRGPLLYQPEKYAWTVKHWSFGEYFHYYFFAATKRESREAVLNEQDFDYSYPFIYSSRMASSSSCSGSSVKEKTVKFCDLEEENFLMNIGDL